MKADLREANQLWDGTEVLGEGEEKADETNFGMALRDLEEKFNRIDPLALGVDYMICYAAV
ncbi:15568_t:CDS:2, partial [Racocetra fulgida]